MKTEDLKAIEEKICRYRTVISDNLGLSTEGVKDILASTEILLEHVRKLRRGLNYYAKAPTWNSPAAMIILDMGKVARKALEE
jgi:hypothetical protein